MIAPGLSGKRAGRAGTNVLLLDPAPTVYSKGLSDEVGPQGVRVVSVAPGFTETDAATALIDRLAGVCRRRDAADV